MRRLFIIACCIMITSLQMQGKGEGGGFVGIVKKVGTFLDSMAVKGVDRSYIDAPTHPWQIILRGNVNQSDLKLSSTIHQAEEMLPYLKGDMIWEPRIKTVPSTYAGIWAGYRGYGFGYSWNLGGDDGRILTFGATGGSYGVNLRIHWIENDNPKVSLSSTALYDITTEGEFVYQPFAINDYIELGSPIKTRTLQLDGYYLFNGKKCSYAAAYDQSVLQRRSAGSLMAGAMYFHSTTSFDTNENADFILFMNDIGKMKTWEASAGVGYIYNWVPAKGLLVSAMAIPMLTFYNHYKIWHFDSNVKDRVIEEGLDEWDDMDEKAFRIRPSQKSPETSGNSSIRANICARLSITYEWNERIFLNAFGQFSHFRYKIEETSGRLNDWYINIALGIRL